MSWERFCLREMRVGLCQKSGDSSNGCRTVPQHFSSYGVPAYVSLAQDSPSQFEKHHLLVFILACSVCLSLQGLPLLLVSRKWIPCLISVRKPLLILSALLISSLTNGGYYLEITCFGLCIITKYFKGTLPCLSSWKRSSAGGQGLLLLKAVDP